MGTLNPATIMAAFPTVLRQTAEGNFEYDDGHWWHPCKDNDPMKDANACRAVVASLNDQQLHAYNVILSLNLWGDRSWQDWRDTASIESAPLAARFSALLATVKV